MSFEYQFIFHSLIDGFPNHRKAGDGINMLQNDPSAFRNVIMHSEKKSEMISNNEKNIYKRARMVLIERVKNKLQREESKNIRMRNIFLSS